MQVSIWARQQPTMIGTPGSRPTVQIRDEQIGHLWLHFDSLADLRRLATDLNKLADANEKAATLAELDKQFAELPVEKPAKCPACDAEPCECYPGPLPEEPQVFQQGGYHGPVMPACNVPDCWNPAMPGGLCREHAVAETPASTRG